MRLDDYDPNDINVGDQRGQGGGFGGGGGGGGGAAALAEPNRTTYQLQSGRNHIDSTPRAKDGSITVVEGHEDIDTLVDRQGKTVRKACSGARDKMKKTVSGYPPNGITGGGNVARKFCDDVPDFDKPIRLDLENHAGTNYTG